MRTWTTPNGLAFEGEQTGDGRYFVAGAFTWEDGPWPLRVDEADDGGHSGAVLIGSIEQMDRAGSAITGAGTLDDEDNDAGARTAARLDNGDPLGTSIDMDDMALEFVLVDPEEPDDDEGGTVLLAAALPHGSIAPLTGDRPGVRVAAPGIRALVASAGLTAAAGDGDPLEGDTDAIVLFEDSMDAMVMRVTRARVRGATLVQIPAFHRAAIALDPAGEGGDEGQADDEGGEGEAVAASGCRPCVESLRASAARPSGDAPRAYFADPGLSAPTPMRYWEEGGHMRAAGHLALWDTCHTGFGNDCIRPPRSASGYRSFHVGSYQTAEGDLVAVGALTIGGGHADQLLSYRGATAHYDDVATRAVDVRVGEDAHGIWAAGVVRPAYANDPERMRELRAAPPSGDWRWVDGALELAHVHAINMPGYPVPQIALAASGAVTALVAPPAPELTAPAADQPALDVDAQVAAALAPFVEAMRSANRLAAAPARARLQRIHRERAAARLRGAARRP